MVLGLAQVTRWARPGWPRFVVQAVHRNASLIALVLLAVHIVTSLADSFVSIHLIDVFVPFVGSYQPLYLGLGALALDIVVVLIATSLVRERLGLGAWRVVHWGAYACWPLAIAHGLGMGTDSRLGWVDLLNAACIVAVLGALGWRVAYQARHPQTPLVAPRR